MGHMARRLAAVLSLDILLISYVSHFDLSTSLSSIKSSFFFLQEFNFFFYPHKSPDVWTLHKLMNVTEAASTLQLAESFFGTNRGINEEKVTGCPRGTQCVFMCVTESAFEKPDTLTNLDCVLTLVFTFCHVFFIPHLFNYCEIVFLICSNSKFRF